MKYVWLNINTGKFSNTFSQEDVDKYLDDSDLSSAKINGWKLIKYECVNDDIFELYDQMQIRQVGTMNDIKPSQNT